jgi:hypothetical protein
MNQHRLGAIILAAILVSIIALGCSKEPAPQQPASRAAPRLIVLTADQGFPQQPVTVKQGESIMLRTRMNAKVTTVNTTWDPGIVTVLTSKPWQFTPPPGKHIIRCVAGCNNVENNLLTLVVE